MIKIMTPNRSVIGVTKVEPVVEKRLHFNGSDIRLCEVAKGTRQKITGLYLTADEKNLFPFASGNLLVCNLKPDLAESILRELLSVGYWDFSSPQMRSMGARHSAACPQAAAKWLRGLMRTMKVRICRT